MVRVVGFISPGNFAPMKLDVSTIAFAGGLASFASGVFLFLHWFQTREDKAARAWGAANCGMGIGIGFLALGGALPVVLSTVIGPMLLGVREVGVWCAARIFNRGSIGLRVVVAVMSVAIATPMAVGATGHDRMAAVAGLAISAAMQATAALEFWRCRQERLRGRWSMISLLSLRVFALLLGALENCLLGRLRKCRRWDGSESFISSG